MTRPEGGVHPDRTLLAPSAPARGLRPKYSCGYTESARAAAGMVGRGGRTARRPACPGSPGRGSCPHGACGPGLGSPDSRRACLHLPLPLRLLKCRRLWSSRPEQATPSCPLNTNALPSRRHELQISLTAVPFPLSTSPLSPRSRRGSGVAAELRWLGERPSVWLSARPSLAPGRAVTAAVTS